MHRALLLLLLVPVLAAPGCSYRMRQRPLGPEQVPDGSRMTNYLSAPLRPGSPTEETPGGISREAVVDEAWVTRLEPGETCFHIVVRQNVSIDQPLSDWNIAANGQRIYVDKEDTDPEVFDYDFTGERTIVDLAAVGLGALSITEPEARIFRVVQRKASFCGPGAQSGRLELELEIPQDDNRGSYGERFRWNLR